MLLEQYYGKLCNVKFGFDDKVFQAIIVPYVEGDRDSVTKFQCVTKTGKREFYYRSFVENIDFVEVTMEDQYLIDEIYTAILKENSQICKGEQRLKLLERELHEETLQSMMEIGSVISEWTKLNGNVSFGYVLKQIRDFLIEIGFVGQKPYISISNHSRASIEFYRAVTLGCVDNLESHPFLQPVSHGDGIFIVQNEMYHEKLKSARSEAGQFDSNVIKTDFIEIVRSDFLNTDFGVDGLNLEYVENLCFYFKEDGLTGSNVDEIKDLLKGAFKR